MSVKSPSHTSHVAPAKRLKITVVGDGNVGKTCLLMSFSCNQFPEEYLPTVFDTHPMNIKVDGVDFPVVLWDTAGQEEYARLRILSYPKTDCFIICYSIDNPTSFNHVKTLWIPEVRRYCPKAAILLLGTKLDNRSTAPVSVPTKDAKTLKKRVHAQACMECSAKTGTNLEEVFEEAVRAVIRETDGRNWFSSVLLCGSK